jgi:hypothetical protein
MNRRLHFPLIFLAMLLPTIVTAEKPKNPTPYWAYQPLQPTEAPALKDDFITNPIDAFILKGLQENDLKPNSSAQKNHLIRRVYYDTTGLPPTKAQLNATDQSWPDLVDQLLDSPHFGEKMASHWLDLVRYAETNGFERDSEKPEIWRYRDYVVDSFNQDKPYNRFLLEQLAGDELPDRNLDSHIATGFMALMQRDDEPVDRPQAHADVIGDIVDVTGEAFMGSTMNCSKCHDHKGDTITQADYFSMMSFFDGIQQDQFKGTNHTWRDPEALRQYEEKKAVNLTGIKTFWSTVDQSLLIPFLKKSPTEKPLFKLSDESHREPWQHAFTIPKNPGWSLPSYDGIIFKETLAPFSQRKRNFTPKNSTIWKLNKKLVLRKEFGLQEIPSQFLIYAKGELTRLRIELNGTTVYDGAPPKTDGTFFIPLPRTGLEQLTTGRNVIGVIAETNRKNDILFDLGVYTAPISDISPDELALTTPTLISDLYGAPFAEKMTSLQNARVNYSRPINGINYIGVRETRNIAPAHIHERGNVHAPGAPVPVDFPTFLPKSPSPQLDDEQYDKTGTSGRRLAFATWLTNPEHPLTTRVQVNRLWQYCFGKGLVETANDFGVFGTGISNQALLDWLASEFIKSGWSQKHILRLMLTSSTYQMSTEHREDAFQVDSTNKLHWRHNARRLSAEEIWDSYLTLTSQLDLEMAGPPVRPKMPQAVLATSSQPRNVWRETKDRNPYRRAVYIHAKRSIKLPILSAFDAPERDISCPSRFATIVPTQALTMLNSEFMNELSLSFAKRLQGPLETQIQEAFQLATGRAPKMKERQNLLTLVADLKTKHQVPDDQILSRLCLLILNLNETIHLD